MKITLLEPAMCCNTGLCGENPDDALVETAANIKWLKSLGHEVSRHNISNDGAAFKQFPQAVEKLRGEGVGSLPYVLINSRIVMSGAYPIRAQWEQWTAAEIAHPPTADSSKNTNCCSGSGCY